MHAFIFAAPPGSAIFHAIEKGWSTTDYLLAHVIDALRVRLWQNTEDAQKKPARKFPEMFPRPADMEREQAKADSKYVSVGSAVATKTTVGEFLKMRAEREQRWREKHQGRKG